MNDLDRQALRRMLPVALAAALVCAIIIGSYGYAYHAPQPHGVKIAVVAPKRVLEEIDLALAKKAPGAFALHRVGSPLAARIQILQEKVSGGLVLAKHGPVQVLDAAADGTALQQVVQTALNGIARAAKRRPVDTDLVPLRAADRGGQSSFVYYLALLIPSIIGSIGIYLVGRRLRPWWRIATALLVALLNAGVGLLIIGVGYGALTTAPLAMYGLAALGAFTFLVVIGGLQTTFGLPGTFLAVLILLFLGQAMSGSVPVPLLPDVYRQVAPWLPNNAIFSGLRSVTYFHSNTVGHSLLVLGIWAGAGLLVVLTVDLLMFRERRRRPDEEPATIFATPGYRLLGRRTAPSAA